MTQNDWVLINAIMDEMCPVHTMYTNAEYLLPDAFTEEAEHYHILSTKATAVYEDGVLSFVHYNLNDVSDKDKVLYATAVCNAKQYLDAVRGFFARFPDEVPTIFYQ